MKYEKLDQMILNRLCSEPKPFCDIFTGDILEK